MIAEMMTACKNHFVRSKDRETYQFVADGIVGSFSETYVVGQYIWVRESILNDGVYKLTAVSTTKLTVDATLKPENTEEMTTVYGLAVPTDFIQLATDIDTWLTNNGRKEGLASESIDSYSVSFANDGSWQSAFAKSLAPYKQVYETPEMVWRNNRGNR